MTDEYQVEKVIGKRTKGGKPLYKVKWEGYPLSQCTWEPIENLQNVLDMVDEYEKSHSTTPSSKKVPILLGKKRKTPDTETPKEIKEKKETKNHSNKESSTDSKEKERDGVICIENDSSSESHNKQYIRVITINKEFKALVEVKKDGLSTEETISTKELRRLNPDILIDFYESKIKFTMKN